MLFTTCACQNCCSHHFLNHQLAAHLSKTTVCRLLSKVLNPWPPCIINACTSGSPRHPCSPIQLLQLLSSVKPARLLRARTASNRANQYQEHAGDRPGAQTCPHTTTVSIVHQCQPKPISTPHQGYYSSPQLIITSRCIHLCVPSMPTAEAIYSQRDPTSDICRLMYFEPRLVQMLAG